MPQTNNEEKPIESTDLFAEVRPGGMLGRCLDAIGNHRKHRWNAYLRACKRIPKNSPVYGSTSFQKINARRHELISTMFENGENRRIEVKESSEYRAVSDATSEWLCGPMVASNFLMGRLLRRLRAKISSANDTVEQPGPSPTPDSTDK